MAIAFAHVVRRLPMRVNLGWSPRLKGRMILVASGEGRVSPRPPDRGRSCTLSGREPLLEAKALDLTGRWFAGDPAVSERRALPAPSPDATPGEQSNACRGIELKVDVAYPCCFPGAASGSLPNRERTSAPDDDRQFSSPPSIGYSRAASTRRRVHMARRGRTARMDHIHSDRRLCGNRHAYDALFGFRFPLSGATVSGNRELSSCQFWNRSVLLISRFFRLGRR